MATKKTNKEMLIALFGLVSELNGEAETVLYGDITKVEFQDWLNSRLVMLDRPKAPSKKAIEKQMKKDIEMDIILDYMSRDPAIEYRVSDIIAAIPDFAGYTTQKITPLMTKLVAEERISKTKSGGKTAYIYNKLDDDDDNDGED